VETRVGGRWAVGLASVSPFPAKTRTLPSLPQTNENRFNNEEIMDILFVITYSGRTPERPE
jgi:hypothetical protein